MKKALMGLGALALMTATPAWAVDPFFPTFGNPGIDVLHYHIELDADPVSGNVAGKTFLTVRAEERLSKFSLDLHALQVSKVRVNGREASFAQVGDKIEISPVPPIPKGAPFLVRVDYAGVPDPLPDPTAPGFDLFLGWFKYNDAAYVVSEPVGASTFFPANDEPDDRATFTFGITVPTGYRALANGTPLGSFSLGAKTRFNWAMLQPMTTWLATVHINKFNVHTSRAPDGTPVSVYYPDGLPASHVAGYALAAEVLGWMEGLVGNYPYQSYGSAIVQDVPRLYYALETQAMSTFPQRTNPPREGLVVHEAAHQWFGNSVSIAKWEDLWFAEGTATYFEFLWDNRNDPAAFRQAMLENYDFVVAEQLGPAVVEAPEEMFTDRTYLRGAAALYALELQVGTPTFFNILRTLVRERRGKSITSETFIRTAERVSGDGSVRPLLTAWLYDQAVPALPGLSARVAKKGQPVRPNVTRARHAVE
jgi:aminopeptidase N